MMKRGEPIEVHRGDILWINCDPSVGAEPRKTRTCLVVSNDIANRFGQAVTVIPTQKHTAERGRRAYMVDLRKPRSNLQDARVASSERAQQTQAAVAAALNSASERIEHVTRGLNQSIGDGIGIG